MKNVERPAGLTDAEWITFKLTHECIEANQTEVKASISSVQRWLVTTIITVLTIVAGGTWFALKETSVASTWVGSVNNSLREQVEIDKVQSNQAATLTQLQIDVASLKATTLATQNTGRSTNRAIVGPNSGNGPVQ
jgi:hypothetical protein